MNFIRLQTASPSTQHGAVTVKRELNCTEGRRSPEVPPPSPAE